MSKFKVGDRVCYTASGGPWVDYQVTKGCEGVVTGRTDDGDIEVNFGGYAEVVEEDLELVTPADPKRDFLERLQKLLREFDAKINLGIRTEDRTAGVFFDVYKDRLFFPFKIADMSDDPGIIYQVPQTTYPITADNIMDFDKE